MLNRRPLLKKLLIILLSLIALVLAGTYPAFLLARHFFNQHFLHWGEKLVNLEKRGLLSKEFGAGWQDVLADEAMSEEAARITEPSDKQKNQGAGSQVQIVDGIALEDYPSLSIIDRLREVRQYSSSIEIVDRLDRPVAAIKTDHLRATIDEFPPVLITALIAAEDKNFRENNLGFEFDSFVRAALRSCVEAVFTFKKMPPRGTSTITQQVAKLFISRLDENGMRRVSRSVDRKVRELRLAVAMRKLYSPDCILEVYLNHCVTSDYGMIGYKDIARGLFRKELNELSDAECIYLARMVKWGRNIRSKIVNQCRIDMPRMGKALGWSPEKQEQVLSEIGQLTFSKPKRVEGVYGPLVDLANEFWLLTLKKNGSSSEQLAQMDLINPNSLIRKKGNLKIRLTVDLPLQKELEKLVNNRGYGPDTTIMDEVRIGSKGEQVKLSYVPKDTLRHIRVLTKAEDFHEPGSSFITGLDVGDTVIVNIRYKKTGRNEYRRSTFYYQKKPVLVNGQYYAYSIMDSRTGKILAYYSKDRLGSRLTCLLKNRTPNGSATVKPIMNAMNYDLGIFKPYSKWTDTVSVTDDLAWKRSLEYKKGKMIGVTFHNSAVKGRGYLVHNHGNIFEGCKYVFDLLASSNNILGVETVYRLNRKIFENGEIVPDAFGLVQYFYRTGSFSRIKDSLKLSSVTGVRVFKELSRIVGVDIDSTISYGKRVPLSDSMYSVALGTLEMNLYEQMHLFNSLYNNDLIERPADHPSLVIDQIILNGNNVPINDTVRRFHPFSDINNLRPTYLGLHKRLVSNPADRLGNYDIQYTADPLDSLDAVRFNPDVYAIDQPLSNYAKSGTTDDVIKPFNVDAESKQRTCYGLWNAVIRVDLSDLASSSEPDIRDLTIACIGECNYKYTGARDGKTLHKFLTTGLLKKAGIKAPGGFFSGYEKYIRSVTPEWENCGMPLSVPLNTEVDNTWIDSHGD